MLSATVPVRSRVLSRPMLDLASVRAAFPALAEGFTYFDNAGGSQTLGVVANRIRDYLLTTNVQLGASYAISHAAGERVAEGARGAASFVNAADPSEVVLGSSTTQLLQNLALAMAPSLSPGDEIIVTDCDHEANIGPWRRLEARGVVVKEWRISTLRLELSDLEPLMTPRTRLVCFTHASNVIGSIHPVAEITRFVHARGAQVCVDGVAYAPHRRIDVQTLDVDYYVFSFYKVYGPHAAMLYGKRGHLLALSGINHGFIGETVVPYKLQPGNLNFELTYGIGGIFEYFDDQGGAEQAFADISAHEEALAAPLLAFLADTKGIRVLGEPTADAALRVPTISFVADGLRSEAIVRAVDPHRMGIRFGDFYARRLIERLGLTATGGVVRVSMVHYNSHEEVARLIRVLETTLVRL